MNQFERVVLCVGGPCDGVRVVFDTRRSKMRLPILRSMNTHVVPGVMSPDQREIASDFIDYIPVTLFTPDENDEPHAVLVLCPSTWSARRVFIHMLDNYPQPKRKTS